MTGMKGVSLVSGGIDSPAATYLMLERGVEVVAVHMDNRPFTDDKEVNKALDMVDRLAAGAGSPIKTYIVPHGRNQTQIARATRRNLGCVFCRRMMLRVAERICELEGADFIITGESLGQVASQTLTNIRAESQAVGVRILRPLIGLDKLEIEAIAREAGTFEVSTRPGLCCTLVPKYPSTSAGLKQVLEEEGKLDIEGMVEVSVSGARVEVRG